MSLFVDELLAVLDHQAFEVVVYALTGHVVCRSVNILCIGFDVVDTVFCSEVYRNVLISHSLVVSDTVYNDAESNLVCVLGEVGWCRDSVCRGTGIA